MFERFSSGYYLGRLYVEPHDGERAVLQEALHERANEEIYATGEGTERLDLPLVMKIGRRHFPVHGARGIPEGTVAVPAEALAATSVRNPPSLREVLVATRDRAGQLLRYLDTGI